jgi:hypothetical protein
MSAAAVVPVVPPASCTLGGESAIVDGSPAIFWLQNPATASILAAAAVAAQSGADHKNIPIAATSFNSSFKDDNRTTTSSYASSIP